MDTRSLALNREKTTLDDRDIHRKRRQREDEIGKHLNLHFNN